MYAHTFPTADLHFLTRSFQLYVFLYFIESLLQSLFGYSIVKAVFCLSRDICVMYPVEARTSPPSESEHYACHRRSLQDLLLIMLMLQFQLKTYVWSYCMAHTLKKRFLCNFYLARNLRSESETLLVVLQGLQRLVCSVKYN